MTKRKKQCACDGAESGADDEARTFIQKLFSDHLAAWVLVLLTLASSIFTFNYQWRVSRDDRLVSDAHKVADESTALLFNGLARLRKLNDASEYAVSWVDFMKGPYDDYLSYKEVWHRDMIIMHFRVERYFGKDVADQLVNTDKLIAGDIFNELTSPSPCPSPPEDYRSFLRLAETMECQVRMLGYMKTEMSKDNSGFLKNIGDVNESSRRNADNLERLNTSIVGYVRAIDSRLTSLGEVSVKVVHVNE